MSDGTHIEWTDASWTPIRAVNKTTGGQGHFCVHVSPGCKNCYAERMQPRFGNRIRYAAQDREQVDLVLDEKMLTKPLRWRKPRRVFVCSMTDLFLEDHSDEWIDRMFAVMALCETHTFQILTKRPERMRDYLAVMEHEDQLERWCDAAVAISGDPKAEDCVADIDWPLSNVWCGVSVEDQERADERIPLLLDTPAAGRFVSAEPLLGPITLTMLHYDGITNINALNGHHGITMPMRGRGQMLSWVIVGGESGPGARPMNPDWARSLRDQCQSAFVPFFLKQWGSWVTEDQSPLDIVLPGEFWLPWADCRGRGDQTAVYRVGKKRAGRLLDGRTWDEYPA